MLKKNQCDQHPTPNQPSYTLPHTIRAVKVTCVNDLKNVHAAVYLDSYN